MSIKLENISFNYENNNVLENVNFEIKEGEIISILGPNGAGKTTLLNIIAGLTKFRNGNLTYNKNHINKMQRNDVAKLIGYVPQVIVPTFDYSVIEYVVTGIAPHIRTFSKPTDEHYKEAFNILKELKIDDLADRSYRQISGGERQQVSIARTVMQKPKFILFDEPTAHLDYGKQIQILKMMRSLSNKGYGIVHTTHNPDHVLLLGGKVAIVHKNNAFTFGESSELLNSKLLSDLYGIDISLNKFSNTTREVCYIPII